jgi:polysaccharide export outer membrane protein
MMGLRMTGPNLRHAARSRIFCQVLCIVVGAALFCAMPILAQDNQNNQNKQDHPVSSARDLLSKSTNDLLNTNLNLVAASLSQITAVLKANTGLLLELKSWVAMDATAHGQIVQDDDLTDQALFSRLNRDERFRAAATRLLQRYGYLLPKINPDSDVAHEHDALLQAKISQALSEKGTNPEATKEPQPNPSQPVPANRRTFANPPELPRDNSNDNLISPSTDTVGLGDMLRAGGNADRDSLDNAGASLMSRADSDQATLLRMASAAMGPSSSASVSSSAALPSSSASSGPLPSSLPSISSFPVQGASPLQPGLVPSRPRPAPSSSSFEAEVASEAEMPGVRIPSSPYSDIPSLYDMYTRAAVHSGSVNPDSVARFGEDVFENAPTDSGTIPIDFPASSDYVVGPGDGLTINLWGGVSQRLYSSVDHEGRITLPEVGPVLVSGHSLSEVQQAVQRVLRTQFRDVSADVSLSRLRTIRVYVVGDVQSPGAYDVSSLSTPLNALLAAGGPTPDGSLRVVKHFRGNALVQQVDLYDLLLRGVRSDMKRLEAGDTLMIPPVGAQVRVDGMVRRPAIYELHGETTLAQVIDLAGGILPTAALSHIEVQRLEVHQKRTMLSLDISGTTDPIEIEKRLAAFMIQDRDQIHIFPIASFNQDAIYLEGHVLRQGRYSYKPGMKLTDLISSYADLLPEPATKYAEIIHLNPPDYHPSVESFNLAAALANPASAPKLQPLDTVRIFGRFDFENVPAVLVTGAVREPGVYQTSGQIHFRDAIQLAGGLAPDASVDSAEIIRPTEDGSLSILSVRLKEAMGGDPINNVLLQPRDHVLVQESMLRADPRSVQIGGQVANPGRYPLTANLRVSDLIRVSGGLKRGADAAKADLTQFIPADDGAIRASHVSVNLAEAMAGNTKEDVSLHDGDVLTIRQVPGWDDLGALIRVQGEVKHPGTYGIRPGERLSSVLERAGGFQPGSYPYGAILERAEVQQLKAQARDQMVLRIKDAQNALALQPDTDPQGKIAKQVAMEQWQAALEQLNSNSPIGRITIRISSDIDHWKNTPADIQLQADDTLYIPKRPDYVSVTGQVFNPTAVAYRPGKSANWYLRQSGGATPLANKKSIFVVRADGSVIGGKKGLWSGDSLNAALQPGDMVVVPEKALSGNVQWRNVLLAAQVATSITSAVFIALRY